MVTSHFPPRISAGVFRSLRFARYLPTLGWNVHVLTIDPKSFEPGAQTDKALLDKLPSSVTIHATRAIYPINWVSAIKGVLTRRKKKSRSASGSKAGAASKGTWQNIKDGVTLPLMTPDRFVGWIRYAVARGKQVIGRQEIDVIYSSGPPWSNQLVACDLKRASGLPWIADFRDPWVDSDFRPQRRGNTRQGLKHRRLERQVVESADRIVMNTARARDMIAARYGDQSDDKFVVISNGYDAADYGDTSLEAVKETSPTNKMVIAHAGSFYGKRNVTAFIDALANLIDRGVVSREQIEVQLIGALRAGRDIEREQIEERSLQDVVRILPPIPHDECLKQLAAADVLLLVQVGAPECIPGKVFEYIALGKPILTLSADGATRDVVRENALGPDGSPEDVASVEAAIADIYERYVSGSPMPAPTGVVRHRYDGIKLTQDLVDVINQVRHSVAKQQCGANAH